MNKITVVIPNYNGKDYLENCLKALYRQEAGTPPFEVLVVDNASGDGSVERAREWLEEKKESADFSTSVTECRFICLEQNTGFCHAVNVGIITGLCSGVMGGRCIVRARGVRVRSR